MNTAAINSSEQLSLWQNFESCGYMPKSGITRSWHISTFSPLRNLHTVSHNGCTVCPPICNKFPFPTSLPACAATLTGIRWNLKVVRVFVQLIFLLSLFLLIFETIIHISFFHFLSQNSLIFLSFLFFNSWLLFSWLLHAYTYICIVLNI